MSPSEPAVPEAATEADFEVELPEVGQLGQDEEWCEILVGGERRRIRFHDYHKIYDIPGFYERLFYEKHECQSPRVIRRLLARALTELGTEPGELRVLDVGAGNGIVGEELRELGVGAVYGIDILKAAAAAAPPDRPQGRAPRPTGTAPGSMSGTSSPTSPTWRATSATRSPEPTSTR